MTQDEKFDALVKGVRGLANEIGVIAGQHDRTLLALLMIVRELAADNAVIRARVDLAEKDFRKLRGWKEGTTVATTRTTASATRRHKGRFSIRHRELSME